jgi:tetratricopeptide (TPR) repeat protein
MQSYSVQDVERVLRLSRGTIRGLINVGFVKPARGKRREYRFSFQDLIVLRAARALIDAKVSRRRINKALQDLRRRLPAELPLAGLSISAVGDRVVVREGKNHFQVDDGQYVLGLDVEVDNGVLRVVEHKQPRPAENESENWFGKALALEQSDPSAAVDAYERAVKEDAENMSAWVNWGRLLHELGRMADAESVYLRAREQCGSDPVLMFNLGVLLEDLGRPDSALDAYKVSISEDPVFADCHYNLARLYQALTRPQDAIRHLGQYRRLVTGNA